MLHPTWCYQNSSARIFYRQTLVQRWIPKTRRWRNEPLFWRCGQQQKYRSGRNFVWTCDQKCWNQACAHSRNWTKIGNTFLLGGKQLNEPRLLPLYVYMRQSSRSEHRVTVCIQLFFSSILFLVVRDSLVLLHSQTSQLLYRTVQNSCQIHW